MCPAELVCACIFVTAWAYYCNAACQGQTTGPGCATFYPQDYHIGQVGSVGCSGTLHPYAYPVVANNWHSVVALPGPVCSTPYGYCDSSTCMCARHRSGPTCATWTGCWGGGQFTAPSTCVCINGRRGPQCEYYAVGSSCYDASLVSCPGGGQCAAELFDGVHESTLDSFQCRCDTGYTGVGCATLVGCGTGGLGITGSGASSRCICRPGFTGRACEHDGCWKAIENYRDYNSACAAITCTNPADGKVCSGHGTCLAAPVSVCECTPNYTGFYCNITITCPGTCVTNGLGCSNHGACSSLTGLCACQAFHEGCDCQIATDPCLYPGHPLHCNYPFGQCVGSTDPNEEKGRCVCRPPWTGPFCDV